jgi:hypothetical protein
MSTPPPAAYGTKMRTGLDGNADWADAVTPAVSIAAATTVNPSHLPMAPLPGIRYFYFSYHTQA